MEATRPSQSTRASFPSERREKKVFKIEEDSPEHARKAQPRDKIALDAELKFKNASLAVVSNPDMLTELDNVSQASESDLVNGELENYSIRFAIDEERCHLCRKSFINAARTTMACGKHHFHNHCAHTIISGALVSECIFCLVQPASRHIYGGSSSNKHENDSSASATDTRRAVDLQMNRTPFDCGNDFRRAGYASSCSTLFKTLGEYKSDYTIAAVRSMLLSDSSRDHDILDADGERLTRVEIKAQRSSSLFGKVAQIFREGMDMDIEEKQREYVKLVHFGDPFHLIKNHESVERLRASGVTPTSLYSYKVGIQHFFKAKYSIEEIAFLGVTRDRLLALGFGYRVWHKYKNVISVDQLCLYYDFNMMFVLVTICRSDLSLLTLLRLDYRELRALQFNVDFLSTYGMSWERFKEFKLSFDQWISLGLRRNHLVNMKVTWSQLVKEFPDLTESHFCNIVHLRNVYEYDEYVAIAPSSTK